jgi:hypothetical protein
MKDIFRNINFEVAVSQLAADPTVLQFLTCGFGASVQAAARLSRRFPLAPWRRVRDRLM